MSVAGAGPPDYEAAARRYAADLVPEAARSALIARLRLAAVLPGVACFVYALFRGPVAPWLVAAAVLFAAFAALVVWHARVDARITWLEALRTVNERGGAPGAGLEAPPGRSGSSRIDLSTHPYAADLDLFGRASLFQWLGPAATTAGERTLARWLLAPADSREVVLRQEASATLAGCDSWREHLGAHGVIAAAARVHDLERFLQWAEGPSLFGRQETLVQLAVYAITAAIWGLVLLFAYEVTDAALWLAPMAVGIVLSFALSKRTQDWLDRAGAGQCALRRYAAILDHAVSAPRTGQRLTELHGRLSAAGLDAPACMRRLNRILGFGELRGVLLFHFPMQTLTLWDFHVLFALERWRRQAGARVRDWLEAAGEMDALASLARVARDNPSWCVPCLTERPVLEAVSLGHPLLPDKSRVINDVRLGPPGTVLLVTGSNMSGKSTLLRTLGLNIILAQAGSVTTAHSLSLPPGDLQTSLRVQDSLELGLSYFMAALARLKGVVDAAEHQRPGRLVFYLLDEILQGTNSVERALAVQAVARHLLDSGAIGAMTTHDLSLAGEEPLATAAELVHFSETVDADGHMRFDYQLKPGLATSTNALRLMQLIGIEV